MKLLITGTAGNVGGALLCLLTDADVDVRVLIRNPAAATVPAGMVTQWRGLTHTAS